MKIPKPLNVTIQYHSHIPVPFWSSWTSAPFSSLIKLMIITSCSSILYLFLFVVDFCVCFCQFIYLHTTGFTTARQTMRAVLHTYLYESVTSKYQHQKKTKQNRNYLSDKVTTITLFPRTHSHTDKEVLKSFKAQFSPQQGEECTVNLS